MSAPVECENHRKRAHSPLLLGQESIPSCSTGAAGDFDPRCAKRTCPNPPCSINNYCMHGEDSESGQMDESDADERAIREMMCSLEQAIRSDEQYYTEDSSSTSSSPLTSCAMTTSDGSARAEDGEERQSGRKFECATSESQCSFKFLGDDTASIDEEVQQLLQQAEDQNFLSNFCENWDKGASDSSDYLIANSPVYPYDDELGVVYNPLLDPNLECSFDCFNNFL